MTNTFNTTGEHPKAANAADISPEFVNCEGLERMFGIKRSLAYQLLNDGAIKGVSVRRRNLTRGKRLFVVDSVRSYLRRQMEQEVSA